MEFADIVNDQKERVWFVRKINEIVMNSSEIIDRLKWIDDMSIPPKDKLLLANAIGHVDRLQKTGVEQIQKMIK